jgi:hypothetical protein
MIRALALSALAVAFAAPAWADSSTTFNANEAAAFSAVLTNQATANQARLQLAHQGYVNISDLSRDATGRWVGTASKDGKIFHVAVILPPVAHQTAAVTD